MHCPKSISTGSINANAHACIYFFSFLNVRMTKRKLSTDPNYPFSKRHFINFFSETKGRLRSRFQFRLENYFQHFKELTIQIKYNGKSVINYQKEEDSTTLFSFTENDTCDTFKPKDNSSIKLLFAKENCK